MKNNLASFSTAKGTLRFYLCERKKLIDSGEELDWSTAQGVWYLIEPYLPRKKDDGEVIDRDVLVSYIREICRDDLHCRREDLKIVAGGRADLYFDGRWTSISWDNIEELSNSGTDGIMIEKDGMSRIFVGFVENYGFAVINTRGFFVDYLDDMSEQSIDKKSNFVLIRDFDPSGLLIELRARLLGIPCIGVNDEMLQYLGLTRKQVQDKHPPSDKNSHWKSVKRMARTTHPELQKEIKYLSKYRIEIDKVHAKVGSKRLFEYVKHKLKAYHRDLNRVVPPSEYVQPDVLGVLAHHMDPDRQTGARYEFHSIYMEQNDYPDLCNNIFKQKEQNDQRIKVVIEADKDIEWASNRLQPIIKKLERVEIDDGADADDYDDDDNNE